MNTLLDTENTLVVNLGKEVRILDPRGMIRNDIEFIRSKLLPVQWKKGATLEEIAYHQGQHDLLKFIEDKVIGRRLDNGSLRSHTKKG